MAGSGTGTPATGFTYDPTTDRGRVRLIISDTDGSSPIFTDAEIDAYLGLHGSVIFLAAAQALDTIATNEALVLKVIKLMDLTTNGAAVAKALRAHAAVLRRQVDEEVDFDWAEMAVDPFTRAEIIAKEALRSA